MSAPKHQAAEAETAVRVLVEQVAVYTCRRGHEQEHSGRCVACAAEGRTWYTDCTVDARRKGVSDTFLSGVLGGRSRCG